MKQTLILSLCAAGMLALPVFGAPAAKAPAAPAKPAAQVKAAVQIDPFSVLPEKLAEMNGKTITREEVKSFILSNSPEGKLPEQINAEFMKSHGYDLVNWYIMDKLVDQAQAKSKINLDTAQIKKMLNEQIAKMPANLRETMTKQLDTQGMTVEKYIDSIANNPQMRKQINREKFMETIVKDVKISDAEVKKFYEEHKATEFTSPGDTAETLRASHILIGDQKLDDKKKLAKANELLAQVKKAPKSFEKLARENSTCPSGKQAGGSLGSFQKGMMVPEFEKAVIALKPGEISATPVKTQFGYHIIRRDLPQKPQVIPFATVEGAIRQMLTNRAQAKKWQEYIDTLRKAAGVKIFIPAPAKTVPAAK